MNSEAPIAATPGPRRSVFFADLPVAKVVRDNLRALLRSPTGGVVQIPADAPGAKILIKYFDDAALPSAPPSSASPVTS